MCSADELSLAYLENFLPVSPILDSVDEIWNDLENFLTVSPIFDADDELWNDEMREIIDNILEGLEQNEPLPELGELIFFCRKIVEKIDFCPTSQTS
jgi:hypothetical protein